MRSHFVSHLAFCGELPGAVHTMPRAEIAAGHFAAAFGQAKTPRVHRLFVYTDCSLLFRGLSVGKQHCFLFPSSSQLGNSCGAPLSGWAEGRVRK